MGIQGISRVSTRDDRPTRDDRHHFETLPFQQEV